MDDSGVHVFFRHGSGDVNQKRIHNREILFEQTDDLSEIVVLHCSIVHHICGGIRYKRIFPSWHG